jgi:predicted metal-dependent hydrolase
MKILKSRRRTLSLSVTAELEVIVKAPISMPLWEINEFVQKHSEWIEKQLHFRREQREKAKSLMLTPERIAGLKRQAAEQLPKRVAYYAGIMGVRPTGVKITSARTRWGSCSGKNGLNFSFLLMLVPPAAIDYVVVHELAHIRVKNHGAEFYREIERYLPDYKQRIALLKQAQRDLGL